MIDDNFAPHMLNQKAVYWPPGIPDGFGQRNYGDPIEISCRWRSTQALKIDVEGEEITITTEVRVSRDVENGGFLFLGTIGDVHQEKNPRKVPKAYEVRKFVVSPNLDGTRFLRMAFL